MSSEALPQTQIWAGLAWRLHEVHHSPVDAQVASIGLYQRGYRSRVIAHAGVYGVYRRR